MTHWAAQYINLPHRKCGKGPDAFDCLGLVQHVARLHYPKVYAPFPKVEPDNMLEAVRLLNRDRSEWRQCVPKDGAIVLMARNRFYTHIGIAIRDGVRVLILHAIDGAAVAAQSAPQVRAAGWGRLTYWEPAPCAL